jgi:hypothetical protein
VTSNLIVELEIEMSRPNMIPCASCGLENNILSRKQKPEFICFNCGAGLQQALELYDNPPIEETENTDTHKKPQPPQSSAKVSNQQSSPKIFRQGGHKTSVESIYTYKVRKLRYANESMVGRKEITIDFNSGILSLTDSGGLLGDEHKFSYYIHECTFHIYGYGQDCSIYLVTPDYPKIKPNWEMDYYEGQRAQKLVSMLEQHSKKQKENQLTGVFATTAKGDSSTWKYLKTSISRVYYSISFWNNIEDLSSSFECKVQLVGNSIVFIKDNSTIISENSWHTDRLYPNTQAEEITVKLSQVKAHYLKIDVLASKLHLKGDFENIFPGCLEISFAIGLELWIIDEIMKLINADPAITIYSPSELKEKYKNDRAIIEAEKAVIEAEKERLSKICKQCGGDLLIDQSYHDKTKAIINTAKVVAKGATLLAGGGMNGPLKWSQGSERFICEKCGNIT